jgi:L-ribulokinase
VIGIDFGTLSGRAVVVRVSDGRELGEAVHHYRHGVIDRTLPGSGIPLPPDWALQDPDDYLAVLGEAVPRALQRSGVAPDDVIGVGTAFTACTVLPTLADGTPLCQLEQFRTRPHAYVKLWRHHAAQPQADRINQLAVERAEWWLARYGGKISAEWEFAKALELLEEDPDVYAATDCWVEAADWIVWQLTGAYVRNACAAGYKGILQDGSYPDAGFLSALHPSFGDFPTSRLNAPIGALGRPAGVLDAGAARLTGLREGTVVSVGNVDAHATAPAARVVEPNQLLLVTGTSTCHLISARDLHPVPGMCGVVAEGIVPGLWGYEAGQSGVGDIFGWFSRTSVPAEYRDAASAAGQDIQEFLTQKASALEVGRSGLLALDWHSGNRSTLVDHELSGLLVGLTMATRPEETYRVLLEATAFGTRAIVEAFESARVAVEGVTVAGGLTKNPLLLRIYADVLDREITIVESEQAPALGAAIHAAVAAGAHPDVRSASAAMGAAVREVVSPDAGRSKVYRELYAEYLALHDYFGRGGNDVMHRLRSIQRRAVTT